MNLTRGRRSTDSTVESFQPDHREEYLNELLARVIAGHGGLERWNAFTTVTATIVTGAPMSNCPRSGRSSSRSPNSRESPWHWPMRLLAERVPFVPGSWAPVGAAGPTGLAIRQSPPDLDA